MRDVVAGGADSPAAEDRGFGVEAPGFGTSLWAASALREAVQLLGEKAGDGFDDFAAMPARQRQSKL